VKHAAFCYLCCKRNRCGTSVITELLYLLTFNLNVLNQAPALKSDKHLRLTQLTTKCVTPWSKVLLEKLTDTQLVMKFLPFMETEGSLTCSPATGPCPKPDESNIHLQSLFLYNPF
jgi:hypothetical protein